MTALRLAIPALLLGCSVQGYPLGDGGASDGGDLVEGDAGDAGDVPDESTRPCIPIGPDDTCNGQDDDCNGVTDDLFDLARDPENCGSCGNRCVGTDAVFRCDSSACVFVDCELGFADLDGDPAACEYRCPLYPPQPEDCNGVDDDCDGEADEADELPPAPAGPCRDLAATPCAGTVMVCDSRGTPAIGGWYCGYPPEAEFDPLVPNGIVLEERLCDGHDGDCDGVPDDPFPDLGLECDNGLLGACRDGGSRVCDPSDPSRTICDLSLPPDPLATGPTAESCNGIDDDCNGIVDDTEGPGRVVDDMVEIDRTPLHFWIDRYEASRPDATASAAGTAAARTCSRAGVLPWTSITFDGAQAACAATGKRLCTAGEFAAACGGASGTTYPYGATYDPLACNGLDFDGIPGGDDDDVLLPAGSEDLAACASGDGARDLSGNAREWTDDARGDTGPPSHTPIVVTRGGAYDTPATGLACAFDLSRAVATTRLPSIGFRCCSSEAP